MRYSLFVILISSPLLLKGQTPPILDISSYKQGLYLSFEEFRNNSPSVIADFKFGRRWNGRKKLISLDSSISSNKINQYWGVSTGDSLYINSRVYQSEAGFVNITNLGRYCYFTDEVSLNDRGQSGGAGLGGGLGGGVSRRIWSNQSGNANNIEH